MRRIIFLFAIAWFCVSIAAAAPGSSPVDAAIAPASAGGTPDGLVASWLAATAPDQCSAEPAPARRAEGLLVTANHCPYEGSFCYNGGFTCAAACSACNKAPGLCPFGFCICFDT